MDTSREIEKLFIHSFTMEYYAAIKKNEELPWWHSG